MVPVRGMGGGNPSKPTEQHLAAWGKMLAQQTGWAKGGVGQLMPRTEASHRASSGHATRTPSPKRRSPFLSLVSLGKAPYGVGGSRANAWPMLSRVQASSPPPLPRRPVTSALPVVVIPRPRDRSVARAAFFGQAGGGHRARRCSNPPPEG